MTILAQPAVARVRAILLSKKVQPMKRFFFDVATDDAVRYDYQGRMFGNVEEARALAELIALDIACSEDNSEPGEVQVRNVSGSCLFSVSIQAPEAAAA